MTKQLQQKLNSVVDRLKQAYHPEKIILFGSAASGKIGKWSDLDLAIIKKTDKRFYDRIGEVLNLLYNDDENSPDVGVDVLVYTPQEYIQMSRDNWFIGEEINKKGKIVYELSR